MTTRKDLKLESDKFFKTGDERYVSYPKQICPFCGGFNVHEETRGGGIFSSSDSFYYCNTCNKEHRSYNCKTAVREDVVSAIIQDALDNKLSTKEMVELLKKINVNVYQRNHNREYYGKIRKELKDKELKDKELKDKELKDKELKEKDNE